MANIDKAFGLRALGNLSATGAQAQYGFTIADNQAGAIFQGDLVTVYDGYLEVILSASKIELGTVRTILRKIDKISSLHIIM